MYKTYMEYLPQTETKNKQDVKKPQSKLREEVSKEFNVSDFTVRKYISLLDLPEELRNLIVLNHEHIKKGFFEDPLFIYKNYQDKKLLER